jgi:hypothetical protein
MGMDNEKEKDDLRKSINDLFNSGLPDEAPDIEDIGNHLPGISPVRPVNYDKLKEKAEVKAKKTLTSLLSFYLSRDIIVEEEYIQAKLEIDQMALTSLIYQMQTCERAITTLLRTIDSGELTPRHFEVLGTLQKTLLDIVKSQTMYIIAAEESAKKLSRDKDVYQHSKSSDTDDESISSGENTLNVRGTRDLMKAIQQSKIEDDFDETEQPEPQSKPEPPIDLDELEEEFGENIDDLDVDSI